MSGLWISQRRNNVTTPIKQQPPTADTLAMEQAYQDKPHRQTTAQMDSPAAYRIADRAEHSGQRSV
ncbi:hypothetical protein PPS11_40188 [Pseudomonas putida S11]|nr:hypothetical protein PPS11_40188 [Pseudomonas putida S11]